jgi:hypothetical protein
MNTNQAARRPRRPASGAARERRDGQHFVTAAGHTPRPEHEPHVAERNGETVRPVQELNGQCSLIPRFLADEREAARSKAETDLDNRFEYAAPPGVVRYASVAEIDAANQATFARAGVLAAELGFQSEPVPAKSLQRSHETATIPGRTC